jgi:hypothetical protein
MIRHAIAAFILASSAMISLDPAYSQAVQYQFSPPPAITPLPSIQAPSLSPGFGAAPPVLDPGGWNKSGSSASSSRFVGSPGQAPVTVPVGPGSSSAMGNCAQAGAAAGIGANELGGFVNQCLN